MSEERDLIQMRISIAQITLQLSTAENLIKAQATKLDLQADAIVGLNAKITAMKAAEDAREIKQLKWGISAIGAGVMTLGTLIWSNIGAFIK